MGHDLEVLWDRSESALNRNGTRRSFRCASSASIVRYFLDDLSLAEEKVLTNHFSECALCSAKLLALEISADFAVETVAERSNAVVVDWGRAVDTHRPAPNAVSARNDRARSRRASAPGVIALDDRKLLTPMGLALSLGARITVVETSPVGAAAHFVRDEPRAIELVGGRGWSSANLSHWDLAIDELARTASIHPIRFNAVVPHVAA
jgi:hypothetical protein